MRNAECGMRNYNPSIRDSFSNHVDSAFRIPYSAFGLLLPPIGAQAARHDYADERDQPKMRLQMCVSLIPHSAIHNPHSAIRFYSYRSATSGSTLVARQAGTRQA